MCIKKELLEEEIKVAYESVPELSTGGADLNVETKDGKITFQMVSKDGDTVTSAEIIQDGGELILDANHGIKAKFSQESWKSAFRTAVVFVAYTYSINKIQKYIDNSIARDVMEIVNDKDNSQVLFIVHDPMQEIENPGDAPYHILARLPQNLAGGVVLGAGDDGEVMGVFSVTGFLELIKPKSES